MSNVFRTFIIKASEGANAVAICDALGYPDKGMFTAKIGDEGNPVAYIASGIVDDQSMVLQDAVTLHGAVSSAGITLAQCQAFKAALEASEAPPLPQAETIKSEVAGTLPAPTWVQPTGAHDAYPLGASVTHGGKKWRSLIAANVWAPGVSGWREHWAANAAPPAWVQPTGAHDAYKLGAKVTHLGFVWTNVGSDANVWEPGVFGWTK